MNSGSTSSQKPQKLRERMKEAVRTEILQAAEAVLAEQGLRRARMEEIASRAGVSVGTLYNYFEDRQALLEALRENLRDELVERMDRALGEDVQDPFLKRLERYLGEFTGYMQEHWVLFGLLAEESEPNPSNNQLNRKRSLVRLIRQRVDGLIQQGVEEGVLRPDDAGLYPTLLIGILRGLYVRPLQDKQAPPPAELVHSLKRFFLEGAGVRK
jgi:AcrR family transcriptional regulator